ncbi:hypothetical protein BGZ50_007724 [Haplosporangium sp. Z 11]|nr:hypothetical protein BGZ50_007724 [Haplosporangium sp. Z 11]
MATISTGLSAARRAYNATLARIFSFSGKQQQLGQHSTKIPFRPQPLSGSTSSTTSSSTQDPSSITGLKFCLHMVAFAAPGMILSKKLCDGERFEDMIQQGKENVLSLLSDYV